MGVKMPTNILTNKSLQVDIHANIIRQARDQMIEEISNPSNLFRS
jgi:hypothetical protein